MDFLNRKKVAKLESEVESLTASLDYYKRQCEYYKDYFNSKQRQIYELKKSIEIVDLEKELAKKKGEFKKPPSLENRIHEQLSELWALGYNIDDFVLYVRTINDLGYSSGYNPFKDIPCIDMLDTDFGSIRVYENKNISKDSFVILPKYFVGGKK